LSVLVSVIVPVYNGELFIKECLDSIISQNFDELEILVSDDASTDNTKFILDEYLENKKIKIFFQKTNLGITENCNFLLKKATGKYICFFAGDDIMLPNKISKQFLFMESNKNLSFSYHLVDIFNSDTGKSIAITNHQKSSKTVDVNNIIREMGIPASMSMMVRKSMLPNNLFDKKFNYLSDWLMQIELSINGNIGHINQVLCRYRKYGDNNGKDISLYEHEFIDLLDYVMNKYPTLSHSCLKGKARYFFGKAFRVSGVYQRKLALKQALNSRFTLLSFIFLIILYFPFSNKIFNYIYNKRFILKSKI